MTRIGAISDIHGYLPEITSEVDIFLIAGDLVPDKWNPQYAEIEGGITKSMQGHWLKNMFSDWCEQLPAKHVVVIAGNHDIPIMQNPGIMDDVNCIYLRDTTIELEGVKIHGSPWTPEFGGWAFMKPDEKLMEYWNRIPGDVDVLMTHGPAYGILDKTDPFYGEMNVGSESLREKIYVGKSEKFQNLRLHIFGHIHPARGQYEFNGLTSANVTHVNSEYESTHKEMVFEV